MRHSTAEEIKFLNGIGTWGVVRRDRLRLLKGYHYSALRRENWSGIDRERVLKHVKKLIKNERA